MAEHRRIPGEGLSERMEARTRRRPRLGMSPAFYARLGLDDPWGAPMAATDPGGKADGMVFLSAAPYYAMLRKLASARRRRERRQERFLEQRAGSTMRGALRWWPGEGKLPTPRIASLALESMQLPLAPAPAASVGEAPSTLAGVAWRPNVATPAVSDPWRSTPFVAARVTRSQGAASYAGARLSAAVEARTHADAVDTLPHSARVAVARARRRVLIDDPTPLETVEVIRRSALSRPVVRQVEQFSGTPAAFVARAAMRAATPRSAGASTRAVQVALAASTGGEAEFDRAAAGALAVPARGEGMRPAAARRTPPAQRAAARGETQREVSTLSASPVSAARVSAGRPVAASPVARTSSAPAGEPRGFTASFTGAAPQRYRPAAAAVARALHAAPEAAAVDAHRPQAAAAARGDAPPASQAEARLVRTANGTFTRASRVRAADALLAAAPGAAVGAAPATTPVAAPSAPGVGARGTASPAVPVRAVQPDGSPVAQPPVAASLRAARRALPALRPGSSLPVAVAAEAAHGAVQGVPRVRRTAAVQLAGGRFVAASSAPAPQQGLVAPVVDRGARPGPAQRSGGIATMRAPPAPLVAGETPRPAPGAAAQATPSAPWAEATAAAGEHPSGSVGWAVARLADPARPSRSALPHATPPSRSALPHATPPSRSALPHATPPSFVLPQPEVAPPAADLTSRAPSPRGVGSALVAPAATTPTVRPVASTARPIAAAAPTAVRPVIGSVARAVARAVPTGPAGRAREVLAVAPAPASVRQSGPLSWARPTPGSAVVATVGAPRRAVAPAARLSTPAAGVAPGGGASPRAPEAVFPVPSQLLAELTEAGLVQSSWSQSTPVRTPDGRYVSARVAQALPGLSVLPGVSGPVAVPGAVGPRSPTLRTPQVRFVNAISGVSPQGEFSGAPGARSRPTDWVSARHSVSAATAYRGAMGVRSPDTVFTGAGAVTTPDGAFISARSARGEAGTTAPGGAFASEAAAPGPRREPAPSRTPARRAAAARTAASTTRPARPSLETTLADVSAAAPAAGAPTWAARSDGTPMVRSAQGLFESLARATTAEQVVGVIAARAGDLTGPVPLSAPMRDVVEQIRQEIRKPAAAEGTTLSTRAPDVPAPSATTLRGGSGPVASSATVRRGSTRPVRSSATVRGAGGADDRVSKLVKRLTDLIHLAETERRLSEAQGQVRMAEDTPAARAEGSAPVGAQSGEGGKLDVEVFAREVLEVVNRELELRRERRTEDGDESTWW
ncbi:MAG: hypothetical protein EXR72_15200 [Myxococcales bacterium]|nr:hypothetical protein [Myxococcales bacterium]